MYHKWIEDNSRGLVNDMRGYGLLRRAFSSSKGKDVGLSNDHVFSIAPMMDYTDVFQRTFFRYLSARCVLYTEMVTANALANAPEKVGLFLRSDMAIEQPLVLQLGGNEPLSMGLAARLASHQYGYRQININAGCPSDRVSGDGCFGAKLMLSPRLVADIAQEINNQTIDRVACPVTVKCRIGVNDDFSHEDLLNFIRVVSEQGGVTHFIMHARRAILNANFSPKDNRTIPPLKYDVVYSLVKEFPNLQFTINGGVETFSQAKEHHSQGILGVMVGRQAIKSPYYWRNVDSTFYNAVDPGWHLYSYSINV
jgi:tRNA-dihydrouridine synthase A